jgi:hypothetical protein
MPIQPVSRVHNRKLAESDLAAMQRDLDEIEALHRKLGEAIVRFRSDWNQLIVPPRRG